MGGPLPVTDRVILDYCQLYDIPRIDWLVIAEVVKLYDDWWLEDLEANKPAETTPKAPAPPQKGGSKKPKLPT